MQDKFYVTTAIAYTSRKPHIGNSYEVVLTDAIARYQRQRGKDVFFLTGTDEHGQKIEEIAQNEGITPKDHVDKIAGEIRGIADLLEVSYDHFIRTTDPQHERVVQKIFKKLYDKGDIYKSEYEGWYCNPCESFFTETQLKDGCCPDCGAKVKRTKEEAYFLKLSRYQDRLMQYIEEHPDFIQPEARKKEMVNNFLKPGLQDLCVSRTAFRWGIPVDFDPKHIVYVWIDALSNYITGIGYDPDGSSDQFNRYWPADVHVIGKDILRFHTIYWPIMLMALDLPLPKHIFGHPWLLFGADKMSKSKGNVMYADDLANIFGVEAVRYYVLSEMPFASDGSITRETLVASYNANLANTLGNLVNRSIAMAKKYFGGTVADRGVTEPVDSELKAACLTAVSNLDKQMEHFRVADGLETVIALARRANKYIDETTPWVLAKDETKKDRLETAMFHLLESIRYIAVLLTSFMPQTSASILTQIGAKESSLASLAEFGKESTVTVGEAAVLFNRLDEKEVAAKFEALQPAKKEQPVPADTLPQIAIDDFGKVELRVAKIISCAKIKHAKKLYQLQVDLGYETRQIVSGIAPYYKEDELIGKKVIVIANLAPAKLCGVESRGMLLAADAGENQVKVIFVDDSIPEGSKVR